MLSKICHYAPPEELRAIYFAIFSSHMMFGCQVWGVNTNSIHFNKIRTLQNKAIRIINFANFRAASDPLYKSCKILPIPKYVILQNCLFVHDFLNHSLPKCFQDYYLRKTSLIYNTQTKNSNIGCLFVPSKNTTAYGLKSISHQAILHWNLISNKLKCSLTDLSRSEIKRKITCFLLH